MKNFQMNIYQPNVSENTSIFHITKCLKMHMWEYKHSPLCEAYNEEIFNSLPERLTTQIYNLKQIKCDG